jgi:hypothetical protein
MERDDGPGREPKTRPEVVGRSAGGSRLLKYGGGEFGGSAMGFPEEDVSELAQKREAAYATLFGAAEAVSHEMLPLIPHVDVYTVPPRPDRPFTTLVTGGMSDLPMASPPELGADVRRVELVLYVEAEAPEYVRLLRRLAHFPHDNRTWLHYGHTMPNGNPAEPIFPGGVVDTFFFMDSIVGEDDTLGERLEWKGDPINLLWLVPITTAECALKLDQGSEALLDLFDRVNHPFILKDSRSSYL